MSLKTKIVEYFSKLEGKEKEAVVEAAKEVFVDSEKFEDVSLEDGTVVMIEPAVEVGAAVAIAMDGEIVPVADESHVLADGRTIVTQSGVIVEVIEAQPEEAPEAPAVEEEMTEKPSPKSVIERTEVERKFEALEGMIKEMAEKFEKTLQDQSEELTNTKKELEEAQDKYQKLMEFAAEDPVKKPKTSSRINRLKTFKKDFRTGSKK